MVLDMFGMGGHCSIKWRDMKQTQPGRTLGWWVRKLTGRRCRQFVNIRAVLQQLYTQVCLPNPHIPELVLYMNSQSFSIHYGLGPTIQHENQSKK